VRAIQGIEKDMTKTKRVAAMTACITAVLCASAPAALARRDVGPNTGPPGPCPLARGSGETVQDFSARLIACAADTWSVPGGADRAICIATRESGLVPTASSPTGAYLGLFQHSANYWPSRYDTWTRVAWRLRTSALNGRTNAIVTVRMVHGIGRWATAGWPAKGC
jgi:broad specificity phosphatase PhoE